MQSGSNPFEPPSAAVVRGPNAVGESGAVWRRGSTLIFPTGTPLPDACVKCNGPVAEHVRRKLFWHNPALYILVISPLLYVLVALIVRKRATVDIPLCRDHLDARRQKRMIGLGGVAGGLLLAIIGGAASSGAVFLVAMLVFFAGVIFAVVSASPLNPVRIDKTHVHVRGACEGYLAPLAVWSDQA